MNPKLSPMELIKQKKQQAEELKQQQEEQAKQQQVADLQSQKQQLMQQLQTVRNERLLNIQEQRGFTKEMYGEGVDEETKEMFRSDETLKNDVYGASQESLTQIKAQEQAIKEQIALLDTQLSQVSPEQSVEQSPAEQIAEMQTKVASLATEATTTPEYQINAVVEQGGSVEELHERVKEVDEEVQGVVEEFGEGVEGEEESLEEPAKSQEEILAEKKKLALEFRDEIDQLKERASELKMHKESAMEKVQGEISRTLNKLGIFYSLIREVRNQSTRKDPEALPMKKLQAAEEGSNVFSFLKRQLQKPEQERNLNYTNSDLGIEFDLTDFAQHKDAVNGVEVTQSYTGPENLQENVNSILQSVHLFGRVPSYMQEDVDNLKKIVNSPKFKQDLERVKYLENYEHQTNIEAQQKHREFLMNNYDKLIE